MQPWMTAEEAVERLGVKSKTLYTYASRGWIQTLKQGRRKQYRRVDVEALRERAQAHVGLEARAASALDWGEPVLTTSISAHDRDGPYYRGVPALDLVDHPLEVVAALLWQAEPVPWPAVHAAPHGLLGLAGVALQVPAGGTELETARRLVATLWASAALPVHPDLEAAMVLCADHGLNASTFAARVVASTGASLQACVTAGITALSGPRHGTASLQVLAELHDEPRPDAAGFGHPFYPDGDPRGEALLERCPPTGALAERIARMRDLGAPNLDVGLLAVCEHHGLEPTAASRIFAVGRSVGWIAHVFEQRTSPGLIRPRSRYAGWG